MSIGGLGLPADSCQIDSQSGSFLTMTDLTATQLAERLGVTKRRALDLLRTGTIAGRQLVNGMWLADGDAVARYEVSASRGSGRTLDTATAWGLLWELSGLEADWLSASTPPHSRLGCLGDRFCGVEALAGTPLFRSERGARLGRPHPHRPLCRKRSRYRFDRGHAPGHRVHSIGHDPGLCEEPFHGSSNGRTRRALRELATDRLRGRDDARSRGRSRSRDEHRYPRAACRTSSARGDEAAVAGRTLTVDMADDDLIAVW